MSSFDGMGDCVRDGQQGEEKVGEHEQPSVVTEFGDGGIGIGSGPSVR
jgi:hypothetical protein